MDRSYRFRSSLVVVIVLVIAFIYAVKLFSMQLIVSEENAYGSSSTTTYPQTVSAARGEVLDRHGTVLIRNRATYNVTLQSFVLYNSDDPNGYLLSLAETCIKNGIEYEEKLPLTMTPPYQYTFDDLSWADQYVYKRFLLGREWDADMSAENLVKRLRQTYHIPDEWTEYQARLVMGLRYELDLPTYAYTDTYVVAKDVSAENLAILKELGIPGMDVETTTVREYNTAFAAQLLGHVAYMDEDEYENKYKALGYSMNAVVGKDGFEEAFEEYLHGTDGEKIVTVTADGTVVDEHWEVEPKAGSNVVLSLDIGMQEVAEAALAERILEMANSKVEGQDGYDACAGAAVCMNVKTGEVLCAANYPTYDAREYDEIYDDLVADPAQPLANRALMYAFPPGSTFKMVTALAALRFGVSPDYTVEANGLYTKYEEDGLILKCWIYGEHGGSHGVVNMTQALAHSCNIYFYTMGDMMGSVNVDEIDAVGKSLGLGEYTGIEMIEDPGQLASPELKKALFPDSEYNDWYAADTLMTAIGQSDTTVTPLQLCRYVATLANGGTLYNATFLRRAVASDFQSLIHENSFAPVAEDVISEYEYSIIKEGMALCVTEGTAMSYFKNYAMPVCAKTGTASHGNGGSDNGAFVCWAPADDPEIAIAVYVEHGSTGGYFGTVAQKIMNYYFNSMDLAQEINMEGGFLTD